MVDRGCGQGADDERRLWVVLTLGGVIGSSVGRLARHVGGGDCCRRRWDEVRIEIIL